MKLETELHENDYLQHQLYLASKRKSVKAQKIRTRIIVPLAFLLSGFAFYFAYGNKENIIIFGVISAITFIFYPIYLRILYKRHYSKFVKENYKDKIGKQGSMEIENEYIVLKDDMSEGKIKIAGIKEIAEIKTHYFILINTISSIILPKNDETNKFINILVKDFNVKINKELDWKWK